MTRQLWAPWRMEYLGEYHKGKKDECFFCHFLKEEQDSKNLILWRGNEVFVIMNRYPYNSGHLMVAPQAHVAEYGELKGSTLQELGETTQRAVRVLEKAMKPEGFNVGINIGKASGAGFPGHLHQHIVPRWVGDTNFMPILAETKAIPQHLESTFNLLASHF